MFNDFECIMPNVLFSYGLYFILFSFEYVRFGSFLNVTFEPEG